MRKGERQHYIEANYAAGKPRNPCCTWGIVPTFPCKLKVIMVGTMTTPEGIERGFYYASGRNRFWPWLDESLSKKPDPTFASLKEELAQNNNDNTITNDDRETQKIIIRGKFYTQLKNYGIGICDIIRSCTFKKDRGTDDQQLVPLSYWDGTIWEQIKLHPGVVLLANSTDVVMYLHERGFLKESAIDENALCKGNGNFYIMRITSPSGHNTRRKNGRGDGWQEAFSILEKDLGLKITN